MNIPLCNFTMLVHDRLNLTKQALTSLARAGLKGLRITILDDRSGKETMDIIRQIAPWIGARVIRNTKKSNIGHLRNMVIKESEAYHGRLDYLYISDNDVFFKPGWYPELVNCFNQAEKKGYRIVAAYNHPFHQYGDEVVCGQRSVRLVQQVSHQSALMRWSTYDQAGPVDETHPEYACMSEDVSFSNRVRGAGGKLGTIVPPLLYNTGITNSYGKEIVGADLVKQEASGHPEVVLE